MIKIKVSHLYHLNKDNSSLILLIILRVLKASIKFLILMHKQIIRIHLIIFLLIKTLYSQINKKIFYSIIFKKILRISKKTHNIMHNLLLI